MSRWFSALTSLASLTFLASPTFLATSCSSVDKQTQITLALESETEIPKELDAFTVRVFSVRTGELRFGNTYEADNGNRFPTTLAVIPADEESLSGPLRVEVEGRKGSKVFLKRQSTLSYVKERNVLLQIPLRMACFEFRACADGETCAGGQCVPSVVDPAKLADFDPKLVFAEPGSCFDEEACLDTTTEITVADDCTFPIPEGADETKGNVSIRWAAAPLRILGLEGSDAQEGWIRVSKTQGRLSQGACDSHFRRLGPDGKPLVPDWAQKVYFSSACATKSKTTPICRSAKTGHVGIGAVRP